VREATDRRIVASREGAAPELSVYRRTDYEHMAAIYDSGRALPLEWLDAWRKELSPYLSAPLLTTLDLGSGTGLWAEAFGAWFETTIVGVEPSDAMRRTAAGKGLAPRAVFVGGTAEQIPLQDASCDCAWLSTVVHHIGDLPACAAELRRVLRPDGRVLIRNSFGDRLEGIRWLKFFPAAREVASGRWPTVEAIAQVFRSERFEVETLRRVPETVAPDLRAYHERISVRANSTLTLISDEEFEAGLARLGEAAERQATPRRVVDRRDLLVLRLMDEAHEGPTDGGTHRAKQ
jgi:ubiquinone/menaquinone biosynthesis C-methylase UbiE